MSPVVGRERELALVSEVLEALRGGSRGVLLEIAGEPGIGKSRLLRELTVIAREQGGLVFEGRAAEFEAELAFGMFRDALDDWLWSLPAERRRRLVGEVGSDLGVVFSAFEAFAGDRGPEVQQERYRAHQSVRRLLCALAVDVPVVLVLDDAHWADPGSVELLGYLLAHPPRSAVLIAVGFRPAQLAERLAGALAAAVRQEDAVRVDLAPLDAAAAARLLGSGVSASVRERCFEQSGGNPFLLLELARGVAGDAVPGSVQAALASELSSASPAARRLLHGAAVCGDPFDFLMAARAGDLEEDEALGALEELVGFGLVSAAGMVGQFAFRHPVIRATVYESLPAVRRRAAHARVAAWLEAAGRGPGERAPHVERSARAGDVDAAARALGGGGRERAARSGAGGTLVRGGAGRTPAPT